MKLLLSVDYTNGTSKNGKGEFWAESYVKNGIFQQKEGESIHKTVKRALEKEDGCEFCHNGKPISDVFVDARNGTAKRVGYVYRVKHTISDRSVGFEGCAYFDAWVSIKEVKDLELAPCGY